MSAITTVPDIDKSYTPTSRQLRRWRSRMSRGECVSLGLIDSHSELVEVPGKRKAYFVRVSKTPVVLYYGVEPERSAFCDMLEGLWQV